MSKIKTKRQAAELRLGVVLSTMDHEQNTNSRALLTTTIAYRAYNKTMKNLVIRIDIPARRALARKLYARTGYSD